MLLRLPFLFFYTLSLLPIILSFSGGGGEGATAREVLKWKSVEKVVMVDLDEVACKMCQEHLPEWNTGVYSDPRFEIHYEDAYAFLQNYSGPKFDVVIMDISDPIECGPGIGLYFTEFYADVFLPKMSDDGVFGSITYLYMCTYTYIYMYMYMYIFINSYVSI